MSSDRSRGSVGPRLSSRLWCPPMGGPSFCRGCSTTCEAGHRIRCVRGDDSDTTAPARRETRSARDLRDALQATGRAPAARSRRAPRRATPSALSRADVGSPADAAQARLLVAALTASRARRSSDRNSRSHLRMGSIRVGRGATGLFETCNMAYRQEDFEAVGGFDERTAVIGHRAARPFGEEGVSWGGGLMSTDVTYRFEPEALVHHRWIPGSYRSWVAEQRQTSRTSPRWLGGSKDSTSWLWGGIFLSRTAAAFDLAVAAAVAAVVTRQPVLLVATAPWLRRRWIDAEHRRGRPTPSRVAQLAVGDLDGDTVAPPRRLSASSPTGDLTRAASALTDSPAAACDD